MARLFRQEYVKTRVARDADGNPVKLPNGQYKRVPVLKGGKPVRVKARRWTIEYRDGKGKVRRKVGYTDKAATEQLAAKLERIAARIDVGMLPEGTEEALGPITKHVADYKAHLEAQGFTPRHIAETIGRLEKVLTACGFRRLVDIKASPVERFLLDLLKPQSAPASQSATAAAKEGRSARTRNMYLASVRAFVHWAVSPQQRRLEVDPLAGIEMLDEKANQRRKRRAATDAELIALVNAAQQRTRDPNVTKYMVELDGHKLTEEDRRRMGRERALIYKTLALTGLRTNELRQTKWGDVDLVAGWLDIRPGIAKNGQGDSLPLRADLVADLAAWWEECGKPGPESKVFKIPAYFSRQLKKDLKYAGIPYQTPAGVFDVHSLRHTVGTRLTNNAAVPTRVAQDFMRHSDIRLTTETYTDKRFVDKRRALEALPEIPIQPAGQEQKPAEDPPAAAAG